MDRQDLDYSRLGSIKNVKLHDDFLDFLLVSFVSFSFFYQRCFCSIVKVQIGDTINGNVFKRRVYSEKYLFGKLLYGLWRSLKNYSQVAWVTKKNFNLFRNQLLSVDNGSDRQQVTYYNVFLNKTPRNREKNECNLMPPQVTICHLQLLRKYLFIIYIQVLPQYF